MNVRSIQSKRVAVLALGLCLAGNALAQTSWSTRPPPVVGELPVPAQQGVYSTQMRVPGCTDCGQVTAITVAEKPGDNNAVGVIAGGVLGGVLGHQVGQGMGKDLATIAGAVGGAYAGKKIQESTNTSKVWTVSVKYPDGYSTSFDFDHDPGLQAGDRVKNSGNSVQRY